VAKKLIISWSTYEFMKYISGLIITEPADYIVMVICKDDRRPILGCEQLCRDAIYAQRRHDLFAVGKYLKIKKLYNLNCEPDVINVHKLVAQIQINIMLSQIGEIYYSDNIFLNRIFKVFPKGVKVYSFGDIVDIPPSKEVRLSIKDYDKKKGVADLMVGINNKKEKLYFSYTEKFYKVGNI